MKTNVRDAVAHIPRGLRVTGILTVILLQGAVFAQSGADKQDVPSPVLRGGHLDDVLTVAFGPDGSLVASGSHDGAVNIWNLEKGTDARSLPLSRHGSTIRVYAVEFSPDLQLVAIGGSDNAVRLRQVETGQELRTLSLGPATKIDFVRAIAFSSDGTLVAATSGPSIKLWDAVTGTELRTLSGNKYPVNHLAFRPGTSLLASGCSDKTVKMWDAATGREMRTLEGHSNFITALAFDPGGRLLVSGSTDAVIIWDADTGNKLGVLPHAAQSYKDDGLGSGTANFINSLAFSPDGLLLAQANRDGTIDLWDVSTRQNVRTLRGHRGSVNSVSWGGNPRRLVSGSSDRTVKIWDVATGKLLATSDRFFYSGVIGIRILFPEDWEKGSEQEAALDRPAGVQLGKRDTLARVALLRERLELSPESYEKLMEDALSHSFEQFSVEGKEEVTRDGLEGVHLVLTWRRNAVPFRAWVDVFSVGKQHFRVEATAPREVFDRYADTFRQMLSSVRFPGEHVDSSELPAPEPPKP